MVTDTPQPLGSLANSVNELISDRNYRFVESLGHGGMGEVYVIAHRVLKRRFALKVIHSRFAKDSRFVERMRIEAQATARLRHKHIVDVVDFWVAADGRPCIVMELLRGTTLAHEVITRGSLSSAATIDYTIQLLSALQAAHDLGVVHRDLKPENLFLHEMPERPRILKVLDFGFARVLPDASYRAPAPPAQPTVTGAIVGTPRFASPEALRGAKVDHRADLFAAGAVLYFMLTKRGPYDRMTTIDDAAALNIAPPSSVSGPDVLPELDAVVLKAMQWLPGQRYQSAAEFSSILTSLRPSPNRL